MKYVRTKSGKIKVTSDSGHHRNLAKKCDVVSAGRFRKADDGIEVYDMSRTYKIKPAPGDAARIMKSKKMSKK